MTEAEKQIPNLIKKPEYLKKVFGNRIKDIDSEGRGILKMISYPIKSYLDDKFFHYVTQHHLTIEIKGGLRRRYRIYGVAFSNHGRKQMFHLLKLIYQSGFNQGSITVPRPLWYIEEIMSLFYVGAPGHNLLEHIKNNDVNHSLFGKIGAGLFQLHNIKIKEQEFKLKPHDFSMDYLDPTGVLAREYNRDKQIGQEVKRRFQALRKTHKKLIKDRLVLSHGDFHPENVIAHEFKPNRAAIIDFSEACLAPVYYDIASFLQQLEFMSRGYISRRQYQKLELSFLRGYWGETLISDRMMTKINLYKSWTALKSVVYFMIFKDETNQRFAEYLLRKSKEYAQ